MPQSEDAPETRAAGGGWLRWGVRAAGILLGTVLGAMATVLLLIALALAVAYPQPARHRQPHRLPAQAAAACVLGRWRAVGRVRRGTPHLRADPRNPQGDEGRRTRHRGRQLLQPQRRGLQRHAARHSGAVQRIQEPGRIDHHDAAGAQLLSFHRKDVHAQDLRDPAVVQDRITVDQGSDPRGLHEPDLPRPPRLWLCGRRRRVLRQAPERPDGGRGCHAGRAAQGALGLQPD